MANKPSGSRQDLLLDPPDFSFVLGGPLFQLFHGTRLSDDALELLHRRIVVISLFAWLPLRVLSTLSGQLFLQLAAATVAPIVPLALTMMPLEELLKKLFGVLL